MSHRKPVQFQFKRRDFLVASGVGLTSLLLPELNHAADIYAHLETEKYLGTAEIAATVKDDKVFTEGPIADSAGDIFYTNVYANQILKYSVQSRTLQVAVENSNAANGLAFDNQGRLIACEGGMNDRGRVTRRDLKTQNVQVLADSYAGQPLGAPNDLTLDSKGRIYFTSRMAGQDTKNVNSVYLIDPDGKVERILVAPEIDMPNGVEITQDDKWLYLIESDGRANRSRCIRRYELQSDGKVKNGKVLINFYPGRSGDGLCLDVAGNLYVAAGLHKTRKTSETLDTKPGIHVITPEGKLVGFVETPEDTITNCAFGGAEMKSLFVTCGKYLLQIPAKFPGFSHAK
ncbi:MAG: gnl 1 [Planctomycetaceae bacterium]|nr:gnl 1 [Planctomycetaceae bacterium]